MCECDFICDYDCEYCLERNCPKSEGGWESDTHYAKGNVRRNRTVYFRTKRN